MTTDPITAMAERAATEMPWWADHNNLSRMAEHMFAEGDTDQVVYMLEKPWKYDREWAALEKAEAGS